MIELSILQLIGLGYMINVIALIFIIISYLLSSIKNMNNPQFHKEFLEVSMLLEKIIQLKKELASKKLSYRTQYDYIFLVPYSGILNLLLLFKSLIFTNMNYHMYGQLLKIHKILEERNINT